MGDGKGENRPAVLTGLHGWRHDGPLCPDSQGIEASRADGAGPPRRAEKALPGRHSLPIHIQFAIIY